MNQIKRLFTPLTLLLVTSPSFAGPPVTWSAACSSGIFNLAANSCLSSGGVDTIGAFGSSPTANAATIAGTTITLQPADGTHPGAITSGTQTLGGNKTFSGSISASNLSNTNSGDVTLGGTATSGGLTLSGQILSAAQASASQNGWLSSTDWTNFSTTVQQSKTVKNTSGGTISKGQAVYITGFDVGSGADTVSLAKADTTTTMPSIGIVTSATIANNGTGSIQIAGDATGFDTSALTVGQVAYVSPTTAGALTTTYPTISAGAPPVAQMVGIVTRSDATVGALYVVAQQPDQLQNGTKADNFFIGSGSAGQKTVVFNAGASSAGTLGWTPTATRSILFPNLSGTVTLDAGASTMSNHTLDNSNSYTARDGNLTLQNTADTTKHAIFDLSGNTTGITGTLKTAFTTAKTVTFPDTTTVLAGLGTAQSFTSTNNFLDGSNLSIFIRNGSDTTKRFLWDLSGQTTSTDVTFKTQATSSQSITFPFGTTTDTVVLNNGTQTIGGAKTLTNSRINPRVNAASAANSLVPNWDSYDYETITLTSGTAFTFTNHSGSTPTNGQMKRICVTGLAGGATTFSWGTEYIGSTSLALTATGGGPSKTDCFALMWDTVAVKARLMAYNGAF